MEIQSLVTPFVVRADAAESLAAIARRMWAHEIGALPVFEGDRLAGIISERDIVTAIALGAGTDAPARAHMTRDQTTAQVTEDPGAVAQRMARLGIGHLPALDGQQVIGMISACDLLPVLARSPHAAPSGGRTGARGRRLPAGAQARSTRVSGGS